MNRRIKPLTLIAPKAIAKIVIAGDNDTPSLLTQAVKDCRAIIHEATYLANITKIDKNQLKIINL